MAPSRQHFFSLNFPPFSSSSSSLHSHLTTQCSWARFQIHHNQDKVINEDEEIMNKCTPSSSVTSTRDGQENVPRHCSNNIQIFELPHVRLGNDLHAWIHETLNFVWGFIHCSICERTVTRTAWNTLFNKTQIWPAAYLLKNNTQLLM